MSRQEKFVLIEYYRGNGKDSNLVTSDIVFKSRISSASCALSFSAVAYDGYSIQIFAYFLPPDIGIYYFIMSCQYYGLMYISTPGKQDRRVLVWGTGTNSKSVYMEKNEKKAIEIVSGGHYNKSAGLITLGVTLPNGTQYSDIPNSFFDSLL
nr:uncharacterized protein LOC124818996 [Hydra vulgaris]